MGNILRGKCKSCGFENEFSFGGTRSNYKTVYWMPAIDKETGEFVELNYYEYKNSESKYLFYNDKKLKKNELESDFQFRSFEVIINERDNFCPKCKTYGLNFFSEYLTD